MPRERRPPEVQKVFNHLNTALLRFCDKPAGGHMTDMEWTEKVNDGYLDHPEMTTPYTFLLDTREDGSIEVSCSHSDIMFPTGSTWRESAEISFVIPAERADEFRAALATWLKAQGNIIEEGGSMCTYEQLIVIAQGLLAEQICDPAEANPEYTRGIVELIALSFGTAETAAAVVRDIGVPWMIG